MSDLKLQWSKMSPDRSEQVVVRSNDLDEWFKLIDEAKGVLPTEGFPNDPIGTPKATPVEKTQEAVPMCGDHHVPMIWKTGTSKKTGRPYAFWGCNEKTNGEWCTFKFTK